MDGSTLGDVLLLQENLKKKKNRIPLVCSGSSVLSSAHFRVLGVCCEASSGSPEGSSPQHAAPPVDTRGTAAGEEHESGTEDRTQRIETEERQRSLEDVFMSRHSKLQKQVLALYRQFLRAGRDKPGFLPRIRDEFRENSQIKRTDVMHIEYLYRRGQRQLDTLRDANTKQLGSFCRDKD